ncbi:hypothetical protein C482_01085 [Natrialba chahannaoensis JCM 10990]|uniref:Zinc-ribbon domain-containing protein n=1 Tax=Natrialba chahannaoensis JCM 10990 TaxID=1227492 RepID=M0B7V9_9EURY|nr:zinc ribbon domain-containing protein [Natrialba chahannaoensis]ELZ06373.1 hypothetical protein C482_01085 [Natrialba chahannaoensis JCM 10990]
MTTEEYCWNCGSVLESDANYCSACGVEVGRDSEGDVSGGGDRTDEWGTGEWGTNDYGTDDYGTNDYGTDDYEADDYGDDYGTSSNERTGYGSDDYATAEYGTRGNDTAFAAVTHLLAIFTWLIGPLIVLVVTEDEFVDANARMAVNWQIMFTIYMLLSMMLVIVGVGILGLIILPFLDIAFCVVAAVKANDGEVWQYPLTPEIV